MASEIARLIATAGRRCACPFPMLPSLGYPSIASAPRRCSGRRIHQARPRRSHAAAGVGRGCHQAHASYRGDRPSSRAGLPGRRGSPQAGGRPRGAGGAGVGGARGQPARAFPTRPRDVGPAARGIRGPSAAEARVAQRDRGGGGGDRPRGCVVAWNRRSGRAHAPVCKSQRWRVARAPPPQSSRYLRAKTEPQWKRRSRTAGKGGSATGRGPRAVEGWCACWGRTPTAAATATVPRGACRRPPWPRGFLRTRRVAPAIDAQGTCFLPTAATLPSPFHPRRCPQYQALLDRGWRRSGRVIYRPDLSRSCCPQYTIRLHAPSFRPTKEHRRLLRRFARAVNGEAQGAGLGAGNGGGRGDRGGASGSITRGCAGDSAGQSGAAGASLEALAALVRACVAGMDGVRADGVAIQVSPVTGAAKSRLADDVAASSAAAFAIAKKASGERERAQDVLRNAAARWQRAHAAPHCLLSAPHQHPHWNHPTPAVAGPRPVRTTARPRHRGRPRKVPPRCPGHRRHAVCPSDPLQYDS